MRDLGVIILAAGEGKRMNSGLPKVLHCLGGKPLFFYPLEIARSLNPKRIAIVVGHGAEEVKRSCADNGISWVFQQRQLGTGHAVSCSRDIFRDFSGDLLILSGDVPFISQKILLRLLSQHREQETVLTFLTASLDEPAGYGRVLRDAQAGLHGIVEERDASAEQRAIREINAGIYAASPRFLFPALEGLSNQNRQKEYYLPDVVGIALKNRQRVGTVQAEDPLEILGVNTREELAIMEKMLQERINRKWMEAGVTMKDPETTYIEEEVVIGKDTSIGPNTHLLGHTVIGGRCRIDGNAYVTNARIGDEVHLRFSVVLNDCELGSGVEVEPFSHLNNRKEPSILTAEKQLLASTRRLGPDEKVRKLIEGGAQIPKTDAVTIGAEVRLENIVTKGLVLYPGTKIFGEKTLILAGAEIGYEEPVTLENAVLGEKVIIKGGYIKDSVVLDSCEVRQGFHAREGCLLEENVYCAHNVGMKMAIGFPFVVFGSLINFCDCLIAGGTGRRNHSEIGSGFVHFNYSHRGEKATPSLFGDVPNGVMLNQAPIFLGGLCGVVGPARLGFGSLLSAGKVYRSDYEGGFLVMGEDFLTGTKSYDPRQLGSISRKIFNNIFYIANLAALWSWYKHVRSLFVMTKPLRMRLISTAMATLDSNIEERIKQLDGFRDLVAESTQQLKLSNNSDTDAGTAMEHQEFVANWESARPIIKEFKSIQGDVELRERFCKKVIQSSSQADSGYVAAIQSLSASDSNIGTRWLNSIIGDFMNRVCKVMPHNLKNMAGESSGAS